MKLKRPNPNSETAILSPLIEFLEILSNQGKLRYIRHHPLRLVNSKKGRVPAKLRPSQRGAPDLFIFLPEYTVFIEGKAHKGKLSSDQFNWMQWAVAHKPHYLHFIPNAHVDISEIINWIRSKV